MSLVLRFVDVTQSGSGLRLGLAGAGCKQQLATLALVAAAQHAESLLLQVVPQQGQKGHVLMFQRACAERPAAATTRWASC